MPGQIVSTEKEINLLLEAAEEDFKNEPLAEPSIAKGRLSDLITSPFLKDYNLEEKDIKIIAILFRGLLDGKDGMKTIDILKSMEKDKKVALIKTLL